MYSVPSENKGPRSIEAARRRRRLAAAIRKSLREFTIQLSLLNHQVGAHLELKDADIDCLDLIDQQGPFSPSELARRTGLHPATMTGILDRRAVVIRARRERYGDLLSLYAGMNKSMNEIYAGYDEDELEVIADFLQRTAAAGRAATERLTGD
jgi:hypothetical protein